MNDKAESIKVKPLTETLLRQEASESRWAALTADERNDLGGYAMRMYVKAAEGGLDPDHYLRGQVTIAEAIRRQRRWKQRGAKPKITRGPADGRSPPATKLTTAGDRANGSRPFKK